MQAPSVSKSYLRRRRFDAIHFEHEAGSSLGADVRLVEYVRSRKKSPRESAMNDTTKNTWRSLAADAGLIILLTLVAYLPAMTGGFVFDDNIYITDNPMVRAGDGLHRFWFTTEAPDYYPLTWSVLWLEWRLWGDNATGYHVVNIVLHAVNAVLLWLVLRRLKIPGAWLAGLVFAIHPVNVATVAWISEQKNTLSMFFYLVAILLYLRFDEEGRWKWYGWSLAAFLLALVSKSAVVMLPVVLLGCVWWQRGRVRERDLLNAMPFFVLSLVLGLTTILFQYGHILKGHTARTAGFLSRLAAAGWAPWFYLDKAFLPHDLTVIYPKWDIDASRLISYAPGMVLVGCFTLFWWRRNTWGRPLLFALGYFVVTLFPVLGFFDQGFYQYSLAADHWQYYSIIGVIALVVATGVTIGRQMRQWGRYLGGMVGMAVLLALGGATWKRAIVYRAPETLWRDNVAKNPDAWAAHNNLGVALRERGEADEAFDHFTQAVRLKPDFPEAHYNLGIVLFRLGKLREATGHFEQALQFRPAYPEVYNNLGMIFKGQKQYERAVEQFQEALKYKPDLLEARTNLGVTLSIMGRYDEAIDQFQEALRIKPDSADMHNNLGVMLMMKGSTEQAITHFTEALRIRPDFADAAYNLQAAREVQKNPKKVFGSQIGVK
jgi:protein O-mannosyl-transferase